MNNISLSSLRANAKQSTKYRQSGLLRQLHLLAMTSFLLLLNACATVSNWADGVGSHMPVIGKPCHHWQCFTDSGQKKSAEIKASQENPTPKEPVKEPAKENTSADENK